MILASPIRQQAYSHRKPKFVPENPVLSLRGIDTNLGGVSLAVGKQKSASYKIPALHFYFHVLLFRSEEPTEMLQELERKRAELMREVHAVTAAIKAYAETLSKGHASVVKKGGTTKVGKGHTMSAATKKKLSLAAKARWAKINAKKV
jgi:hypothetical protein